MNPIHTSTRLDLARRDAADRQRRAAEFRLTHAGHRSPLVGRVAALAAAVAVAGSIGLAGTGTSGAVAVADTMQLTDAATSQPVRHGYEQGRPDGWYVVGETAPMNRVPRNVR